MTYGCLSGGGGWSDTAETIGDNRTEFNRILRTSKSEVTGKKTAL